MPVNPGVIPLIIDNVWTNTSGLGQLRDGVSDIEIDKSTTFLDSGNRIYADLSNATNSNRLFFQTYVSNSYTSFGLIPSGTHDTSVFSVFNTSDPDNASNGSLLIDSLALVFQSGKTGTGSYLPIKFNTSGTERIILDTNGYLGINEMTPSSYLDINGDIHLSNITAPVDTINKLYASGGNVYWDNVALNDSSGTQNLSEVLAQGNSAGANQIDMNNNKIVDLDAPTLVGDATNKSYVDIQDQSILDQANSYTNTLVEATSGQGGGGAGGPRWSLILGGM